MFSNVKQCHASWLLWGIIIENTMFSQKFYLLFLDEVLIFMTISRLADSFRAVFKIFVGFTFFLLFFLLKFNLKTSTACITSRLNCGLPRK